MTTAQEIQPLVERCRQQFRLIIRRRTEAEQRKLYLDCFFGDSFRTFPPNKPCPDGADWRVEEDWYCTSHTKLVLEGMVDLYRSKIKKCTLCGCNVSDCFWASWKVEPSGKKKLLAVTCSSCDQRFINLFRELWYEDPRMEKYVHAELTSELVEELAGKVSLFQRPTWRAVNWDEVETWVIKELCSQGYGIV